MAHPFVAWDEQQRTRRVIAFLVGFIQGFAFTAAFALVQLVTFN